MRGPGGGTLGFGKGGQPTPFVNQFHEPAIGSLRYNTSQQGQPLPIIYGTARVPINVLEFWGYHGSNGKGGKGGVGKAGKSSATFSVFVALALAQGPVTLTGSQFGSGGNNRIWVNAGIAYGVGNVGLNAFLGNDGQAPDATFVASDPNVPVIGYSGTAYVTGDPLQLGPSPALPNASFEVGGFERGGVDGYPDDANPGDIIVDLISNARYGAGFPVGNIDVAGTLADFKNFCNAAQLAMSLILDRCQPAARWIEEICELTVSAPFWAAGVLKIVPYSVAGYSRTGSGGPIVWNPVLTPQYSVGDRDLLDWGGETDPVVTTRVDPTNVTNWLALEYYDSQNGFNPNIAYAFDQGAIDEYGLRNEAAKEAHEFSGLTPASASVHLMLQRKQLFRNQYKFKLPWTFALLDPMDIIQVTDAVAGLNNTPVRIISIDEEDEHGLVMTAEELPGVASQIPNYSIVQPGSQIPNVLVLPGNANAPIIFEPPATLTNAVDMVWIGASGGVNWGGCNVLISTDGSTYALAGTIFAGLRQGTLTANLPAYGGANPDNTNTLSVDLTSSEGSLVSASAGDAAAGVTLCYVNGELLSYQTAALTSAFHYNLTTLYRGLYGTSPGAHSGGTVFAYFGLQNDAAGVLKYPYPPTLVGQTISIKLQSFNVFFNELQDAAGLTVYTYTLTGNGSVVPTQVPFAWPGIPQNTVPILNFTFGETVTFAANFPGSVCTAQVAATVFTNCIIAKNGVNVGNMHFLAGSAVAAFTFSAGTTFNPGDIMTITPTRTDATLANLTGVLLGTA